MKLGFGKNTGARAIVAIGLALLAGMIAGCATTVDVQPNCFQMNGQTTVPLQAPLLDKCCDKHPPATNSSTFVLKRVPNISSLMLCGKPPLNAPLSAAPLAPTSQPEPIASPSGTP